MGMAFPLEQLTMLLQARRTRHLSTQSAAANSIAHFQDMKSANRLPSTDGNTRYFQCHSMQIISNFIQVIQSESDIMDLDPQPHNVSSSFTLRGTID